MKKKCVIMMNHTHVMNVIAIVIIGMQCFVVGYANGTVVAIVMIATRGIFEEVLCNEQTRNA